MRQTSANQAANPAGSKNRMPHRLRNVSGIALQLCFLVTAAGKHSATSASLSVWSLDFARE